MTGKSEDFKCTGFIFPRKFWEESLFCIIFQKNYGSLAGPIPPHRIIRIPADRYVRQPGKGSGYLSGIICLLILSVQGIMKREFAFCKFSGLIRHRQRILHDLVVSPAS